MSEPNSDRIVSLLTEIRDLLKPSQPSAVPMCAPSVVTRVAKELTVAADALKQCAERLRNVEGQAAASAYAFKASQRARAVAEELVGA
jgi:hypothetical protein